MGKRAVPTADRGYRFSPGTRPGTQRNGAHPGTTVHMKKSASRIRPEHSQPQQYQETANESGSGSEIGEGE